MVRTAIPIQEIPRNGAVEDIQFTAADAVNDHEFPNSGDVQILAKNDDAAAHDVVVVSVADEHGRTGDLTVTVPAAGVAITDDFLPPIWNQGGADRGKVFVDITTATGVSLAAVKRTG